MNSRLWSLLLLVVLLLSCRQSDSRVPLRVVYQNIYCANEQAGLFWLPDQQALRRAIGPAREFEKPKVLPAVDFQRQRVLLLAMGTQASAGYRLELTDNQAQQYGDMLILPLQFKRPAPESLQATVITRPCMILALPVGSYQQVVARDGEKTLTIAVPKDRGKP